MAYLGRENKNITVADSAITAAKISDGVITNAKISSSAAIAASKLGTGVAKLGTAAEWTTTQNFNATTLTDGATVSWDASANQVTGVTLGGNRTMAAPTNQKDGACYVLKVTQDGTGSRTLSWNAVFHWAGGTAPTLTTTASAVDLFTFVSDGTNMKCISQVLDVKAA